MTNIFVEYFGFLVLGLTGGFGHCTMMCNPVVILVSSRFCRDVLGYKILIPHLFYNMGRIVTYMLLGAIAGFFGSVIQYAGDTFMNIQRLASIIGGIFMIVYAIYSLLNIHTTLLSKINISDFLKRFNPSNPFVFGLAFGLLPCGLSMGAVIGTVASGSVIHATIMMMLFGIGTMVAMMTMAIFSSVALKYVKILNNFAMFFLLAMGAYFIYVGFRF